MFRASGYRRGADGTINSVRSIDVDRMGGHPAGRVWGGLRELGPESQECLTLVVGNLGEIHCHSDFLVLQQKQALGSRLREDLSRLLMPQEACPPEYVNRGGPTL
ncbi:hypothetical protein NDU88_002521 [Pleurodeles waltl]|uniref:Uncharacterized protein n=1 Tax=Pleurodeles waltl TaxID=8319 RepID=A0AAV7SBV6_PLEWA|nr:hypothetical protein NDU88_002521 [Pleurodeles waltl]